MTAICDRRTYVDDGVGVSHALEVASQEIFITTSVDFGLGLPYFLSQTGLNGGLFSEFVKHPGERSGSGFVTGKKDSSIIQYQ